MVESTRIRWENLDRKKWQLLPGSALSICVLFVGVLIGAWPSQVVITSEVVQVKTFYWDMLWILDQKRDFSSALYLWAYNLGESFYMPWSTNFFFQWKLIGGRKKIKIKCFFKLHKFPKRRLQVGGRKKNKVFFKNKVFLSILMKKNLPWFWSSSAEVVAHSRTECRISPNRGYTKHVHVNTAVYTDIDIGDFFV